MNKVLITLFLVPIISSCFTVNYNRFTYYRQTPAKPLTLNVAGLYCSFKRTTFTSYDPEQKYWARIYFFYEDGSVYETSVGMKDSSLNELKNEMPGNYYKFVENNIDATGAFKIVGDTLKIQRFVSTGQKGGYATDLLERYFIINKNIGSLTSLQSYCKWCAPNDSGYDKRIGLEKNYLPVEYNFLPLSEKPDSSKMRYKHKRWYKKE